MNAIQHGIATQGGITTMLPTEDAALRELGYLDGARELTGVDFRLAQR